MLQINAFNTIDVLCISVAFLFIGFVIGARLMNWIVMQETRLRTTHEPASDTQAAPCKYIGIDKYLYRLIEDDEQPKSPLS